MLGHQEMTLLLNTLSSESDGTDGASENSAFCEPDGWVCSPGSDGKFRWVGQGNPPHGVSAPPPHSRAAGQVSLSHPREAGAPLETSTNSHQRSSAFHRSAAGGMPCT